MGTRAPRRMRIPKVAQKMPPIPMKAVKSSKCDVHPWMRSYVAVMTHPYFDTSDKSGSFSIGDVPDGTYEVEAWHEKLGTQTAEVTVSGGAAKADFSFKKPARK